MKKILVLTLMFAFCGAGVAAARTMHITAAPNASVPVVLAIAENANWTTTLDLRAPDAASCTFNLSNVNASPAPIVNLPPHGAFIQRKWGEFTAFAAQSGGYGAFTLPDPNVDARVRLYFHAGNASSAFVVPKLSRFAQHAGEAGEARGVTVDETDGTQVVIFSKPQVFTVFVYDGSNNFIGTETIEPSEYISGAVVSHRLKLKTKEGRIRVQEGYNGYGPNTDADAYGFIAVGPANGTSQAVEAIVGTQ